MDTATRMTEMVWALGREDRPSWAGIRAELGHAVMRRLRGAAIRLLDMRTEFEVVGPGEAREVPARLESRVALAIGRRARRLASAILDPWTEFEALD